MMRRLLLAASILLTASTGLVPAQVPPDSDAWQAHLQRLKREARQLAAAGDLAQATRHAEEARDLVLRLHGPDHAQHAATLHLLGSMYVRGGRDAAAIATFTRALSVLDRLEPPDHMGSLAIATSLADLYLRTGEGEHVERLCQRALKAGAKVEEARARLWMARAHYLLGEAYAARGRYDDAERAYRRAGRLFEAVGGPASADCHRCRKALERLDQLRSQQQPPPELIRRLGVTVRPHGEKGILVGVVLPRSPAALAGLWPGDVIFSHGEHSFREPGLGPEALRKAVDGAPSGTSTLIWISRRATFIRLEVRYGDENVPVPVVLSDQQRTLLAEFGQPDTFTINWYVPEEAGDGRPVRDETWFYHELRTSFGFIDAVFASSQEIESFSGCVFPSWKPESFRGGMSIDEVRGVLGDVQIASLNLEELNLGDPDLEDASLYGAPQIILSFSGGGLCQVMTFPGDPVTRREESR